MTESAVPSNHTDPYLREVKPRGPKLMSAHDAIARFVRDGDTIFLGYSTWANALEWEIARQRKRQLTSVGTVTSALLPLLGSAEAMISAYALGALSPWFRERLAAGEWRIDDYSNQTLALMFMAGALGIPFIPTRSMLGTDFVGPKYYPQPNSVLGENKLNVIDSPFGGERVVALPALRPDVSCVHVQWADEEGNAAFWGGDGEVRWALWASDRIVISAEEIVPPSVLRSDPHRVTVPGFMVDAVVHMPYGAVPWGVPGYYGGARRLSAEYFAAMRDAESFEDFVGHWIDGAKDHAGFVALFEERYGDGALAALRADRTWQPERAITYGWKS
jgi:glutaconate CoA-transferase subunit A